MGLLEKVRAKVLLERKAASLASRKRPHQALQLLDRMDRGTTSFALCLTSSSTLFDARERRRLACRPGARLCRVHAYCDTVNPRVGKVLQTVPVTCRQKASYLNTITCTSTKAERHYPHKLGGPVQRSCTRVCPPHTAFTCCLQQHNL